MSDKEFLQIVKSKILQFDNNAELFLYGSRARGDYNSDSDWDFLVLFNMAVNEQIKKKIRDELFEIEISTNQIISSIIHSKKQWNELQITPFFKNVEKDGIKV